VSKLEYLDEIKKSYDKGENIIQNLKNGQNNSYENIQISYDLQAGSYTKHYYECEEWVEEYVKKIMNYILYLDTDVASILEAGVGEGTKIVPLSNAFEKSNINIRWMGGLDISWSRCAYAKLFEKKQGIREDFINFFVGNIYSMPFENDSVDIVYTVHALEPNGGNEEELLKELYRVTRQYLILIEPDFDLANDDGKRRMITNGYIRDLRGKAQKLNYRILLDEPIVIDENPLNPASVLIIEKEKKSQGIIPTLACPVTKKELKEYDHCLFSRESLLAYPILMGIPCLLPDNAIISAKMEEVISYTGRLM